MNRLINYMLGIMLGYFANEFETRNSNIQSFQKRLKIRCQNIFVF